MNIELTELEYRRLLDLVYVGNWVLNSCRGNDRFADYDYIQSKMFAYAPIHGMKSLTDLRFGLPVPSQKYVDGGIHEAICDYEDAIFFGILAEELACRDLNIYGPVTEENPALTDRINEYMKEFEAHGIDNVVIEA
jgi:hypothetical protein